MYTLTQDFTSFVVGAIIAFALWWAPTIAPLWEKVTAKRVTLLVLFLLVPLVFTLLGCYVPAASKVAVVCSKDKDVVVALLTNIGGALWIGVLALAGSQGGYMTLLRWGQEIIHPAQDPAKQEPQKALESEPPQADLDPAKDIPASNTPDELKPGSPHVVESTPGG